MNSVRFSGQLIIDDTFWQNKKNRMKAREYLQFKENMLDLATRFQNEQVGPIDRKDPSRQVKLTLKYDEVFESGDQLVVAARDKDNELIEQRLYRKMNWRQLKREPLSALLQRGVDKAREIWGEIERQAYVRAAFSEMLDESAGQLNAAETETESSTNPPSLEAGE